MKKNTSGSFRNEKTARIRNKSLQYQDKFEVSQICTKYEDSLRKQIQKFNELTEAYKWSIEKQIEQKKKLDGIKSRIRWHQNHKKFSASFKLCVPKNYKPPKKNERHEYEDFIIQLQKINFDMKLNQQKKFQMFLDTTLKNILKESNITTIFDQIWINKLLALVSNRLIQEDKQYFKNKDITRLQQQVQVNKQLINFNYIICPSPVSVCWHPEGILCIIESKTLPKVKGSYIGTKKYLNNIFKQTNQDQKQIQQQPITYNGNAIQEQSGSEMYNWNIEQNLDFLDRQKNPLQDYQTKNSEEQKPKIKQTKKKTTQSKKSEKQILIDLNKVSPELLKLYKNYFFKQNIQCFSKGKKQTIRCYRIQGEEKQLENDLLFLIYRINQTQQKSIIEITLKNQLKGYYKLLQKPLEQMQFRIIGSIIQEKLAKINNNHYVNILKGMIIQNEAANYFLKNYFDQLISHLNMTPKDLEKISVLSSNLASYYHFDFQKAQKIYMKILQRILKKNEAYVPQILLINKNDPKKKYISRLNICIPEFESLSILNEELCMAFCRKIIPIFQTRSRNYAYLQYRTIMRIILANDQFKNFINKINQLSLMYESRKPEKLALLKQLVYRYKQTNKKLKEKQMPQVRRSFKIKCLQCNNAVQTYELVHEQLICQKCQE